MRSMVDFFLLVLIAGAGDELQGIKKGVMEMVDAVVVNKADGDNLPRARAAAGEYQLALKYLTPATPGWSPPVQLVSALERSGLDTLWQTILAFQTQARAQGSWDSRRQRQLSEWLDQALIEALQQRFFQHPHIQRRLPEIQQQLLAGQLLVPEAVTTLLQVFDGA